MVSGTCSSNHAGGGVIVGSCSYGATEGCVIQYLLYDVTANDYVHIYYVDRLFYFTPEAVYKTTDNYQNIITAQGKIIQEQI